MNERMNALTQDTPCWTETEFANLDLGDARLNKRARILMQRLAAKPKAGVPQACRSWGETMAAYRFFDNEEVDWREILEPHWQQTEQRMAAHPVVLCLQDTTELDLNGRHTRVRHVTPIFDPKSALGSNQINRLPRELPKLL